MSDEGGAAVDAIKADVQRCPRCGEETYRTVACVTCGDRVCVERCAPDENSGKCDDCYGGEDAEE